ncbi:MAG: hydrogen peroxide-inducible genes activator [Myxococcota bacterium]
MRYAVAVDDARNFRQAAARSHVSQSGLSMQVQKLEDLLGVKLFDRSRKPILVTPTGALALEQIRVILRATEQLGQIASDEGAPRGRYRLGVIPTLSSTVLPLFVRDVVAQYPDLELVVEELKTEEIIARLQGDTLDAGLVATPLAVPGLTETPLAHERMFAYLAPGDPLLRRKRVTQTHLRDRELWVMPEGHCFRSQVLLYCESEGRGGATTGAGRRAPGGIHFESGSFQTLIRLVDEGLGATVLPALVVDGLAPARRDAQVRPLTRPTPVREIGLVTARTDLRRRATEALVALVAKALRRALGARPATAEVVPPR